MPSSYTEPIAKTFVLCGIINPGQYSSGQYFTAPVAWGGFSQLLATIAVGANVASGSVIQGTLQYSSSSDPSTFVDLDSVQGSITFGLGAVPTLPGTQRSLEFRGESFGAVPSGAARFVRLAVTTSSSASGDLTDFGATLYGSGFRFPPNTGTLSSSLSNMIYTVAHPGPRPGTSQPGQLPVF
jgi:hypothetical protein